MIKSIKHKGLRKFYETGSSSGIRADHAQRLRLRLTKLDAIASLDDITLKSWDLHQLKGDKAGQWAIKVSGNWRLFFTFEDGHVYLLDFDDYH